MDGTLGDQRQYARRRPQGRAGGAEGEFDLAGAHILADALDEACRRGCSVKLDLSAVTFFTASTMATIVSARRNLADKGCTIVIVHSADVVKRVLRLTNMSGSKRAEPTLT